MENKNPPVNKRPVRKVKKKKIWPIVVAVIGICILAIVAYAVIVLNFYKPNRNDLVPFDTHSPSTGDEGSDTPITVKDTKYNFLVMGHDRVSGLTDVIMIVSYDIKDQSVNLMQIPRDTYVELDDYYYHKINGAYTYYMGIARDNNSQNPEVDGCRAFADFLEKNMCIKIHYTAVMGLEGFRDIVDAIGGVDMYVPQRLYYPDEKQGLLIDLQEGWQHLDGNKAEQFVRCRNAYANADLGRGDAQKLFVTAFIQQLQQNMNLKNINTLTELATTIAGCVDTDLTINDMVFFGKNFIGFGSAESVKLENIQMLTMPGHSFSDGLSYYMMNKEAVTQTVNDYFNIYHYDISASFDKNSLFVDQESDRANEIYNMSKEELDMVIYNAEQLAENGLE